MLHGINEDIIHGFLENAWKLDDLPFLDMVILQKQQIQISAGYMFHGMAYMERAGMINVTTSVRLADPILDPAGTTIRGEMNAMRSVRQKSSWAETIIPNISMTI